MSVLFHSFVTMTWHKMVILKQNGNIESRQAMKFKIMIIFCSLQ